MTTQVSVTLSYSCLYLYALHCFSPELILINKIVFSIGPKMVGLNKIAQQWRCNARNCKPVLLHCHCRLHHEAA